MPIIYVVTKDPNTEVHTNLPEFEIHIVTAAQYALIMDSPQALLIPSAPDPQQDLLNPAAAAAFPEDYA